MSTIYQGNWPNNVSRDAKYSVRQEAGAYVVGMLYETDEGEKWHPTTDKHPRLVEMVNAVKTEINGTQGGPFYINEWRQVIVPAGRPVTYYLAGDYPADLEFEFEGKVISGKPYDFDGGPLAPGCTWTGPHVGIPYVLKPQGRDIYYTRTVGAKVTKDEKLSAYADPAKVAELGQKIVRVAGFGGGRFYVNEFRQIFKPQSDGDSVEYIYVGALTENDPWYPRPHSENAHP